MAYPISKTTPDFTLWQRETLDKFAVEAFHELARLNQANDQLRADLKEAMAQNRVLLAMGGVITTTAKGPR